MFTSKLRVGNGVDVHPLVKGEKLILGGIHIEHHSGCAGHSDGDALIHSVIDAILGAMNEGDIGDYFPSSDDKYKNANSQDFLNELQSSFWSSPVLQRQKFHCRHQQHLW